MIKEKIYLVAAFLASFLLFQLELMVAKALLPVFGGSYLVWSACMVFFQGVLLLGYIFAHLAQKNGRVCLYAKWHIFLLIISAVFVSFDFSYASTAFSALNPSLRVLLILSRAIGMPFFMLSMASLVLQRWFLIDPKTKNNDPYILYGASNLGAFCALLTYPLIFEPLFSLVSQAYIWRIGYLLLIAVFLICLPWKVSIIEKKEAMDKSQAKIGFLKCFEWFLFSCAPVVLLLAVTNFITFDVASVPLLWILPLAVYLMTFVLTFKINSWFPNWVRTALFWVVPMGLIVYFSGMLRLGFSAPIIIVIELCVLFVVVMNCHGYLYQSRPKQENMLTFYYVIIALGGFCGSFLVGVCMPIVSLSLIEYPLAFLLACLAITFYSMDKKSSRFRIKDLSAIIFYCLLTAAVIVGLPWVISRIYILNAQAYFVIISGLLFLLIRGASRNNQALCSVLLGLVLFSGYTEQIVFKVQNMHKLRNFYGFYRIYDSLGQRWLQHGTTIHGHQYLEGEKAGKPLGYYHASTPAGQLLLDDNLLINNVGMIGLGTGALCSYFKPDQKFTIFELDADNINIAKENFSFLNNAQESGANIVLIVGDGRICLKDVIRNEFDLFILDAFNSGSIPVHLLTIEAISEYFRVLKDDGVLLMHISNKTLDLLPVITRAGKELNVYVLEKNNQDNVEKDAEETYWVVLSRSKQRVKRLIEVHSWNMIDTVSINRRLWTDQYTNIFDAFF